MCLKAKLAASVIVCTTMIANSALALESCRSAKMLKAEREVNRQISVLIDNAPLECKLLSDKGTTAPCSFICASTYTWSDAQRRAGLVYLAGIIGNQINQLGPNTVGSVTFIDRTTAQRGYGLRIEAAEAARLQHEVKTDILSAQQFLEAVQKAFQMVQTKH